jgi:hypothetical protein
MNLTDRGRLASGDDNVVTAPGHRAAARSRISAALLTESGHPSRLAALVRLALTRNRPWALSNSGHCLVGGPERSWVTWSGGVAREAVTVFRHGRGCRWAWRDPPSLSRVRHEGAPGVALTARSSGRARVTPAHLHACVLSACYFRIAPEHAIAYEKSLSAEQFHTPPGAIPHKKVEATCDSAPSSW